MPQRGPSGLLLPRVLGALLLRAETFAEVARDDRAGVQAGLVVLLGGVVEAAVYAAVHGLPAVHSSLIFLWMLAALIGWIFWSILLWLVGVRLFEHAADFTAVARAVAFAHAPTLVYGLGAVAGLTRWEGLIRALSLAWFSGTLLAATRGAFQVPLRRALAILLVAFVGRVAVELAPQGLRMVPGRTPP